jgi:hypothetical protein
MPDARVKTGPRRRPTGSLVDDVHTAALVLASARVLANGGTDRSVGGARVLHRPGRRAAAPASVGFARVRSYLRSEPLYTTTFLLICARSSVGLAGSTSRQILRAAHCSADGVQCFGYLVGGGSLGATVAPIWEYSGEAQFGALPSASKLPARYVVAITIEMRFAGR